jgi:large repetitive protein
VDVAGPFTVLKRPVLLQPKGGTPPAAGDPARGPVAWWKLDETEGLEAADASGHHLAAHAEGTPRWLPTQGRLGGAVELEGARTFLDCGDATDFDFRDGLSVSLWIKARDFKKTAQTLVAKGGDTWRLHSEGDKGQVVFSLSGPQTTGKDRTKLPRAISSRAVDDDQWHHLVGVYDGQRVALYVDGALDKAVTASGPIALNTEPLWLGKSAAARPQFFNGALDDVRLFRCGLSEEEIKRLYREGAK